VLWDSVGKGIVYLLMRNTVTHCTDSTRLHVTIYPNPDKPVITRSGDSLYSSSLYGNQWYRGDTKLLGDTSQIFYPKFSDTIRLQVTSGEGCISEFSLPYYYDYINGVDETSENISASISPNPINDKFTLRINVSDLRTVNADVFNSLGDKVLSILSRAQLNAGSHSFDYDLSALPAGIYLIRLQIGDGFETLQFIKI
jgi:hypothetical protein